jgi:acylphosphatase
MLNVKFIFFSFLLSWIVFRWYAYLNNVNGSLATLSSYGGFRRMIRARANEFGIVGSIRRCRGHDCEVEVHGSKDQVNGFRSFIRDCVRSHLIESLSNPQESLMDFSDFDDFIIDKDLFPTGRANGTIRGKFTDDREYDTKSIRSESEQEVGGGNYAAHGPT